MNLLIFLTIIILACESIVSANNNHSSSHYLPNMVLTKNRIQKMTTLKELRRDDDTSTNMIELQSLIGNTSSRNGIVWLSNTAVSHHQLENAQMTLRGGDNDNSEHGNNGDIAISESFSFDKKKVHLQSSNVLSAFSIWYMKQMEMHELRTKCISAGVLGLVADIFAQEIGHYLTTRENGDKNSSQSMLAACTEFLAVLTRLDKRRMLAMFFDGALTTGPLLHYVYAWYERILPIPEVDALSFTSVEEKRKAIRQRFGIASIHVLFDNFVMAILYVFLMMITTATLEGKYATIPHEIRHDFYPAICASWKASCMGLAPMQLLSFHFLPMELRVLAVNVQDVIWVTVMSFVTHRNRQ